MAHNKLRSSTQQELLNSNSNSQQSTFLDSSSKDTSFVHQDPSVNYNNNSAIHTLDIKVPQNSCNNFHTLNEVTLQQQNSHVRFLNNSSGNNCSNITSDNANISLLKDSHVTSGHKASKDSEHTLPSESLTSEAATELTHLPGYVTPDVLHPGLDTTPLSLHRTTTAPNSVNFDPAASHSQPPSSNTPAWHSITHTQRPSSSAPVAVTIDSAASLTDARIQPPLSNTPPAAAAVHSGPADTHTQPLSSIAPAWHLLTSDLPRSDSQPPLSSAPAWHTVTSDPAPTHSTPTQVPPRTPHCFYGQQPQFTPVSDNWPRINPEIWSQNLSLLTLTCLKIYDTVRDTAIPNFAGARIPIPSGLNIQAWRDLTQEINYPDKLICDFLCFGFPLDHDPVFYPNVGDKKNHSSALQYPEAIQSFIDTEVAAKAVIVPFNTPCFIPSPKISPLMTRPKHDSQERRVIMDLSWGEHSVNSHIDNTQYLGTAYKLALPTVDTISDMILSAGQGSYIYKRDLSRAYKQLRTCPLAWPLTAFQHRDETFLDISICFGVKPGAMFCQRTTDVIAYTMKQKGHNLCSYIDDLLGIEKTQAKAQLADTYLGQKLDDLGLDHKEAKHFHPAQSQVCLGILFDTVTMTKSIPPNKLHEIGIELQKWIRKQSATKRELQSLAGTLLFIAKCSTPARMFINSILADLRNAPTTGYITLSQATLSDITFFLELFPLYNGVSLLCHPPLASTKQVDCDSCLSGAGARFGELYYSEQFPTFITDLQLSITHLEMLNLLVATRLFAAQWTHHTVTLGCDNAASVAVLQTGKSRDRLLAACAKQMWILATAHDVTLNPIHRSGDIMQQLGVDALSRRHLSQRFQNIISQLLRDGTRVRVPPALFTLPPV